MGKKYSGKVHINSKEELTNETVFSNKPSSLKEKLLHIYTKRYKTLMIIPNILLFLSLCILFFNLFTTGDFIDKGVSIKGGVSIEISTKTISSDDMKQFLTQNFPNSDIDIKTLSNAGEQEKLLIEASDVKSEYILSKLIPRYNLNKNDYSSETTGSKLGNSFYKQLIIAVIVAFLLMAVVVYVYYRLLIPSLAIILAAFSDMITTLAIISLLDVKLTTAGIAAFLMLIGYSVDTDILLTTRVVKGKEGTVDDRIFSALKTGMTMNAAAIATTIVALIITTSETIKQIMLILLIGLLADIIYTWIQNVGLLKWYLEKKHNVRK